MIGKTNQLEMIKKVILSCLKIFGLIMMSLEKSKENVLLKKCFNPSTIILRVVIMNLGTTFKPLMRKLIIGMKNPHISITLLSSKEWKGNYQRSKILTLHLLCLTLVMLLQLIIYLQLVILLSTHLQLDIFKKEVSIR